MANQETNTLTRRMVTIGLVAAITCILAPFAIPIPVSPVPITLTNLVILIGTYVLGARDETISVLIYLLLGLVGLPVFSGFSGGVGKLAGPTGGYLIGFIFLALIAGFAVEHFPDNRAAIAGGMILGTAVLYIFGTIWLCVQMQIGFLAGLAIGCLPYLIGDAVKIVIAILIGPILRARIGDGVN